MFDFEHSSSSSKAVVSPTPPFIALVTPFRGFLPFFLALVLHQSSATGVCISMYACGPLHATEVSDKFSFYLSGINSEGEDWVMCRDNHYN